MFTEQGAFSRCLSDRDTRDEGTRMMVRLTCSPNDPTQKLVKSVSEGRSGREEEASYRAVDHWVFEGSGSGRAGEELCRKNGFSDAAFFGRRAKFGGMQVNEAKRLPRARGRERKLEEAAA
jgi:hypothetical protein